MRMILTSDDPKWVWKRAYRSRNGHQKWWIGTVDEYGHFNYLYWSGKTNVQEISPIWVRSLDARGLGWF